MPATSSSDLVMLRHALATMVYRGSRIFRDAPVDFGTFRIKEGSRTPVEIVAHMGDLFDWALSMAKGRKTWRDSVPQNWDGELVRFYVSVKALDAFLSESSTLACSRERLFQGPIADALTHVGQLAMLRHVFGFPIRGENYFKAEITIGRVGREQAAPRKEF